MWSSWISSSKDQNSKTQRNHWAFFFFFCSITCSVGQNLEPWPWGGAKLQWTAAVLLGLRYALEFPPDQVLQQVGILEEAALWGWWSPGKLGRAAMAEPWPVLWWQGTTQAVMASSQEFGSSQKFELQQNSLTQQMDYLLNPLLNPKRQDELLSEANSVQ